MKDTTVNIIAQLNNLCVTDILKYNVAFLENAIHYRMDETQCISIEGYSSYLKQNKEEASVFFNSLYNSYSQFFRNLFTFSVLENLILPKIIQKKQGVKRKEIRIWSSACASGQEAYSLAILLEELKNGNPKKFNYRICATDLSESQIIVAKKGQYKKEVLGNVNLKQLKKWFTKNGDVYTVKLILKEHITFSEFDLFDEKINSPDTSIFGDFDLIVCANILFYYTNKYREKILKKIQNNISKGGYLVIGEVEREFLKNYNFKEIFPRSSIYNALTLK